jgi:hypothetical protein
MHRQQVTWERVAAPPRSETSQHDAPYVGVRLLYSQRFTPSSRRPAKPTPDAFVSFLTDELGTDSTEHAPELHDDALRMTVHLIMSTPEYQIV